MRIGIIGGGISGLATAWFLQEHHQVVLFEADDRLGGHLRTLQVPAADGVVPVEVGCKYLLSYSHPHTLALWRMLGIDPQKQKSRITITDHRARELLVVAPETLRHVGMLLRQPARIRTLLALQRFLRMGVALVEAEDWSVDIPTFVARHRFPRGFAEDFLVPFFAASWGAPVDVMARFPVADVVAVMWRGADGHHDVEGGNGTAIEALLPRLGRAALHTGRAIRAIRRDGARLVLVDAHGAETRVDRVVLATSALAAQRLVRTLPGAERWGALLDRFTFFPCTISIHRDPAFMPPDRRDWSTINHFYDPQGVFMTEWSGQPFGTDVFRTWLKPWRAPPRDEVLRHEFHHLAMTTDSPALQAELAALQGHAGLFVAGMYTTGVDNHESALRSAYPLADRLAPGSPARAALQEATGAL